MTIWDDSAPLPGGHEGEDNALPPAEMEPADQPGSPETAAGPAEQNAWSPEQLLRLENEWRRLQRSFAYHPHVRVVPLKGDPPDEYQVDYRVRTVLVDDAGELAYASAASIHLWLPPGFPHEPPLLRPISSLFHPNIVAEGIYIDRYWTRTTSTLAEVVLGVGAMLAFQAFDVEVAWNAAAAEWVIANPHILPTDPDARMEIDAGGDPLARICRYGPRTMEQIREQLKQMGDALLSADGAPNAEETASFAARMRQALGLFLEEDIPDELRLRVAELDDFARELSGSLPQWKAIREYRAAGSTALSLMQRLKDVERSLGHELAAIDSLCTQQPAADPRLAIRQLPAASSMELLGGNLANLIARCDPMVAEATAAGERMRALCALRAGHVTGLLQKRLEAEAARAADLAQEGEEKLAAALAAVGPVLATARIAHAGLRRMIDWREYADLSDRAQVVVQELLDWGAAGLQAFFVRNASGQFGPFELEQKLTLGGRAVVVRNLQSTHIEVMSPDSGKLLSSGGGGEAELGIDDAASGSVHQTTFALTANCEEMAVQLDYVIRESDLLLGRAKEAIQPPPGWMGQFHAVVSTPAAMEALRAEHGLRREVWIRVRDDLRSLRPFKERLATFRLLQRTRELAARVAERMKQSKRNREEATARVSTMVAGSNTDLQSGRLQIPAKWAREYPEQLHRRDTAQMEIQRLHERLREAAGEVRQRITSAELRGLGELPQLDALGSIPEAWATLAPQIEDGAIVQRLEELEGALGSKLMPEDWPGNTMTEAAEPRPVRPEMPLVIEEPGSGSEEA